MNIILLRTTLKKESHPLWRTITLFLLLLATTFTKAQHPYYYTINDENGLPSNEVYQVIQDNFGFMWIGCDAGLYRYDGFNFKPYTSPRQNSRSMSNLTLDRDGNIWCQNFTGQIFKIKDERLELMFDASNLSRQYPFYTIDPKNQIWIATDNVIIVLSSEGKILKKIKSSSFKVKPEPGFSDIECDQAGTIYVTDISNHLYTLNSSTFESNCILLDEEFKARKHFFTLNHLIYLQVETAPKRSYIFAKIDRNQVRVLQRQQLETENSVHYTVCTHKNKLIMGTSDGAYVLNKDFSIQENTSKWFKGNKISFSYVDKEGNSWFTSLQNGIFVIPNLDIEVYNSSNSILPDNNISAIYPYQNNKLFVGTYAGDIGELNTTTGEINLIKNKENISYRTVRKFSLNNDHLYVARGPFSIIKDKKEEFISTMGNCRDFMIKNDSVFFVSSDRIGILVRKSGTYETNILRKRGGKKVVLDKQTNIIYFACTDGLFEFKGGELIEVLDGQNKIYAVDLDYIQNTIWIATATNGIQILKRGKIIDHISQKNHLTDNRIKLVFGNLEKVYISTLSGLEVLHLKTKKHHLINARDGLGCIEINDITSMNNSIYLATIKGLYKLPDSLATYNTIQPSIRITHISIDTVHKKTNGALYLNYNDHNITISFIGTAHRSRGDFHYEYRLKNFNNTWQKTDSKSPVAKFISIPSGEYVFEVVTVNEDGQRSGIPAKLTLFVEGPYWEKWWFYTLIACLAALVVALFFAVRIKILKRNAITKNKLILSQLTALKAQMNPHFMFNTLNSIQDLILKSDIKKTNYYLSKFSNLMRKVLEASDNYEITIQEEIEMLQLYLELEELRFGDDFKFEIRNKISPSSNPFCIPSMIIQPFAENAMKHGLLHKKGQKKLDLLFYMEGKDLFCVITDNGIGIKKGLEIKKRSNLTHKSFATKATEKRLGLINTTRIKPIHFDIKEAFPGNEYPGTQVTIQIPLA